MDGILHLDGVLTTTIPRRKKQWPPNNVVSDGNTIKIKLTKGKWATIDKKDYPIVYPYRWHTYPDPRTGNFYAVSNTRKEGKMTVVYMHRLIMGPVRIVDHRDHDGLNNTRENLRSVNHTQNAQNQLGRKIRKSRFKGLVWDERLGKWRAKIIVNKKSIHLGRFSTEEAAARAYDEAALKYFNEFSLLNFPESRRSLT